jgi:hypothetical protein
MLANPAALQMAIPAYNIDQIIGTTSGSFTVAAPTAVAGYLTNTQSFNTQFNDSCFFQGIFSTNGGTTWNDFGVYQPNLTTPGEPVLQTVTCQGYMQGETFIAVGKNWYDNVHSTSATYTIEYKVVFFAKNTQEILEPLSSVLDLFYTSAVNFQKVFSTGEFNSSTSSSTSITHDLGYAPKARAWFIPTSPTYGADGIYELPAGAMTTLDWFLDTVQINTTEVIFSVIADSNSTPSGIGGIVQYKIYLDS